MIRIFFTAFAFLSFMQVAVAAPQQPVRSCDRAGPNTNFCTGHVFERVDEGETNGISYWLHRNGHVSKVVVQRKPEGVEQARIESQIIAMVSTQADARGRQFAFSDLAAGTTPVGAFGTLSYRLMGKGQDKAILHSYVAIKGVVVQVISQIALKRAGRTVQDLQMAHDAALEALQIVALDPDA